MSLSAKRSLKPLRHATRSGRGHAAVRDFVQTSKRRKVPTEQARWRRGFFNSVGHAFSGVGDAITDVATDTVDAVSGAADKVGDALTDIGNTIVDGTKNTTDTVKEGAEDVINDVRQDVGKAGDAVGQVIDTTTDAVKDFVHAVGLYAQA